MEVGFPFDLAEVKLAEPAARPGTVAKVDAIEALTVSPSRLVTVVAPAGYGKTTLLARWAEADSRSFAWVALDERDDDPVVLLRYVAGAINRIQPIAPEVLDSLSAPGALSWAQRVPPIGGAIAAMERPLVLVLDDLHALDNPSCLDAVAELVEYVPEGSQIATASREEPSLPLGRWRAQGLLQEVRTADLRLDEREARLLLEAAGVEMEAAELSELTERTEGWPAGLYLAALSLQAGAPSLDGAGGFTGDDRFVSEYFRSELLARLPEAEARFLKRTSVLDRLTGGLCDFVLETTGSAATLERLERTNAFLVPLDRRGQWYRYHHLFGELLRTELERDEPEVVLGLNGRAMAWCIENEMSEDAIGYGHAADETDTVASLVDALGPATYWDGRLETLEEWLGWFSEDELARYPAVVLLGAWTRALTGHAADAERWMAIADGATSAIPLSDGSKTIDPAVATLRACMMPDGVERAVSDAELALEQLAPTSFWRGSAHLARGVAYGLLGEADRAREDLESAVNITQAAGAADDELLAHSQLALLAAREGTWAEAGQQAQMALTLIGSAGMEDYSTSGIAHVATVRVALHESRQDDARAAIARAHRLRPQLDHSFPWLTIQVGLELTRAHLTLADPGAAQAVLTEAERVLGLRPQMGYLVEDARELRERVDATSGPSGAWAMSLTGAELRLLPYLATHLSFPEIGERLFISRNTVKSEAVSIYRKLGASSRSEAIERSIEVGLLEPNYPRGKITPEG